jgi:predicted SprT family Zn-dependent metalloprotease
MKNNTITTTELKTFADMPFRICGLNDWKFQFNNRKRALGLCNYNRKTIYVSRYFINIVSKDKLKDTVLHELSHALAGAQANHGPNWKAWCLKVGAKPNRIYDMPKEEKVKKPKGKYTLMFGSEVITELHRISKWANNIDKVSIVGRPECKGNLTLVQNY